MLLLKGGEVTRPQFDKKVDSSRRYLDRVEAVALYKGEFSDLEKLVKRMLTLREGEETIEAISSELLYATNQLEKSINNRRYKKDKHTAEKFKDWE